MNPTRTILSLNLDVLNLILALLYADSPSSLPSFARVSKACKALAIPIIYNSITLKNRGLRKSYSSQLVDLLSGPENEQIRCIRHVIMQDGAKSPLDLEADLIGNILQHTHTLHSFAWDSPKSIPETLLTCLETRFPNARLSIEKLGRTYYLGSNDYSGIDLITLDERAIKSPLLWSLSGHVRRVHPVRVIGNQDCYSDLYQIDEIISSSDRLRHLKLEIAVGWEAWSKQKSRSKIEHHEALPHNFCLPQLISLTLTSGSTVYGSFTNRDLTRSLLLRSRRWNIETLALSHLNPKICFEELRAPNLETLSFTFHDRGWVRGTEKPQVIIGFLNSCDKLKTLRISNCSNRFQSIWPSLLHRAQTLQSFTLHGPSVNADTYYWRPFLSSMQLEQLALCKLSHLGFDLDIRDATRLLNNAGDGSLAGSIFDSDVPLGPFSGVRALDKLNLVTSLKIWVNLPEEESVFAEKIIIFTRERMKELFAFDSYSEVYDDPEPTGEHRLGLRVVQATEAAMSLFKAIYKRNPDAKLKELNLCFTQFSQDGGLHYQRSVWVKRAAEQDLRKNGHVDIDVEMQGRWEKERWTDNLMEL